MTKLLEKQREVELKVKFGEPILIGTKGKENFGRFEPGKFWALGCKDVLKSRYCIGDSKERDVERN